MLWVTSFDNQLAPSLLTTCNRLVVKVFARISILAVFLKFLRMRILMSVIGDAYNGAESAFFRWIQRATLLFLFIIKV